MDKLIEEKVIISREGDPSISSLDLLKDAKVRSQINMFAEVAVQGYKISEATNQNFYNSTGTTSNED